MQESAQPVGMYDTDYRVEEAFVFKDLNPPKNQIIGRTGIRFCRFCRRWQGDTTFEKQAHVIPQGFGNRYLTKTEQCDSCNEKGGRLENEFIRFLEPLRAMAVSRTGKANHAEFKTKMGSSIKSGVGMENRVLEKVIGDPDLDFGVTEAGLNIAKARVKKIKFQKVARALGWMGWNFFPEVKLYGYEHIRLWMNGRLSFLPVSSFYMQPVLMVDDLSTGLFLFKRRNANKRLAPFIVAFLYEALLFSLPVPDRDCFIAEPQLPTWGPLGAEISGKAVQYNRETDAELILGMVLGPHKSQLNILNIIELDNAMKTSDKGTSK